jgi:hypothetical protein
MEIKMIRACLLLAFSSLTAFAKTPQDFLTQYEKLSGKSSISRGQQFFTKTHGKEWSCSSCHNNPPITQGKHMETGKRVKPLAPAFNPKRFTKEEKVNKWFKRNCNDVLGRECTWQEKADVLAYLISLK